MISGKPEKSKGFAETLVQFDVVQAHRFNALDTPAREIAENGIKRHLRACREMDVRVDVSALREIIDDAQQGRLIYAEEPQYSAHPRNFKRRGK